jgi:hypothetical protein
MEAIDFLPLVLGNTYSHEAITIIVCKDTAFNGEEVFGVLARPGGY